MSNIDPQTIQQIVQFLTTYGPDAGKAAAGVVGAGVMQTLESGTMTAIKSIWSKVRHKSVQEGGIAEEAIIAFEAAPSEPEYQRTLSFVLKRLFIKDSAFANEITQLFSEVQNDPVAGQFIQHISGNAQVGVAGVNYGPVSIHQTPHQGVLSWQESITTNLREFVLLWTIKYGKRPGVLIDPFLSEFQRKLVMISDKLIALLSQSSKDMSKEIVINVSHAAGQLETLGRMEFRLDGGVSVNKFNELGDDIVKGITNLIDQINAMK